MKLGTFIQRCFLVLLNKSALNIFGDTVIKSLIRGEIRKVVSLSQEKLAEFSPGGGIQP